MGIEIRTKYLNRTVPGEIIAVELGGISQSLVFVESIACVLDAGLFRRAFSPIKGCCDLVATGTVIAPEDGQWARHWVGRNVSVVVGVA